MTRSSTVLLIGADRLLGEALSEQFEWNGEFVAEQAADLEGVFHAVETSKHDAVVLDLDLVAADPVPTHGLARLRRIDRPLIMISGGGTDGRIDSGSDIGAAVTKPFKFETLLRRVRAEIRNGRLRNTGIAIGPYRLLPVDRMLARPGADHAGIRLTEKETAILEFLASLAENRVASKEDLLDEVWGYSPDVTTHTLETHIYRLRGKIEPDPSLPQILLTERGGYRLSGEAT